MKRLAVLVGLLAAPACRRDAKTADPPSAPAAKDDGDEHAAPIEVTCEPAIAAAASSAIELRGVVGVPPDRSAIVSATVAGRVVEVRVHEGDRVKAGAPIALVDDPALGSVVAESEAAVGAAKASLANADAALARAKRLVDQGIAPRRDVEDATARRATAAAELTSATARRDLARQHQDRAHVVAPIAGVVIHVLRRAGELVDGTAATPLIEIADTTTLEVRADAPAAELVHLSTGLAAELTLDALPAQPFHAELVAVSPSVDPTTALGSVRASIATPPTNVHLALGLAGSLRIGITGAAAGVSIPAVALRRATDGATQVVVCDGKVAKIVVVTVSARHGDRADIASGLQVGQLVATNHVVGVENGAALAVKGAK